MLSESFRSSSPPIAALRAAPLTILLDYDGTLVPIAPAPNLAAPDETLLGLLSSLIARPRTELHLVSGRARDTIEAWFAHLPATLWAEHGFWRRPAPQGDWEQAGPIPADWLARIYPILEDFTHATPGSLIEEKSASLAWHYRIAEPALGAKHARELRLRLGDVLRDQPLEVLEGKKVIEVRPRGIGKAMVSERVLTEHDPAGIVLAIGDDRTDEDLFRPLPASSVTIAVGTGPTAARYVVDDYRAVRQLLSLLL